MIKQNIVVTFFKYFFVQEQYAFCHEAMADFLDGFETYANFKQP